MSVHFHILTPQHKLSKLLSLFYLLRMNSIQRTDTDIYSSLRLAPSERRYWIGRATMTARI